ncbi:MAG: hypothetical protein WDZ72_03560 [Cyclobacteriaceae bacterium]
MKKILLLVLMSGIMLFPACEGPEGPQGPPGQDGLDGEDGEDGIELLNLVFEGQVNFTEENDFVIGSQLEISPGANLLVFLEVGQAEGNSVWRLLPQNFYPFEGAMLTYNYQYTATVFIVFMEGNFDLTELDPEWTENQTLRIVVLPGFMIEENSRLDLNNYEAVMNYIGMEEEDIVNLELK